MGFCSWLCCLNEKRKFFKFLFCVPFSKLISDFSPVYIYSDCEAPVYQLKIEMIKPTANEQESFPTETISLIE